MSEPYKTGDIIYKKYEDGYEEWIVYVEKKDVKSSILPTYRSSMNGYGYDERWNLFVVNLEEDELVEEYFLYEGDIPSSRRFLIPLSNYLKGNIDLTLFLHAYCKLFVESNQTDKLDNITDTFYSKEQLKMTGIEYKFKENEERLTLSEAFSQITDIINEK